MMTREKAISTFVALPLDHKLRMLSILSHNLTICARSAYSSEVDDGLARKRLRAFNELLHLVTGHLMHILAHDSKRYPDDVFMSILFEEAEIGECEPDLVQAFDFSYSGSK
jgi:hypothetical protein